MRKYWTTGTMAEELNVKREKVSYAIYALKLKPKGHAGITRLFTDNDFIKVRRFIHGIK